MRISKTCLASVAAVALFASPAAAQNAAVVVDNTISDVGNTADSVGNSIATGANSVATAADNAVDIDITTDPSLANTTTPSMDGNMVMNDANMMAGDPMMDDNMMVTNTTTTTTMQQQQSGGGGRWGLLGLLGLAGFLFRPKKAAIHLDERNGR